MKYSTKQINKVSFIEADNERGFKVVFSPIGASVYSITFNGKLITKAPEKESDFFSPNYKHGKTIGPIIGKVKEGKLLVGDKVIQLEKNDGDDNVDGTDYRLNACLFQSNPVMNKTLFSIIYMFNKKKGKDLLPGNISYYISYSFSNNSNDFLVDFRALSDELTPMSMSNFLTFNLEGNVSVKNGLSDLENGYNILNGKVVLENEEIKIEMVPNGYSEIYIENDNGLTLSFRDDEEHHNLIKEKELYHRAVLYKFSNK